MTHNTFGRTTWKKAGTLSVLGLAALSLLPQAARADNDNFNNDGIRLAQRDGNQRTTIRGTVQSDGNGNVFTVRTNNGRTVTVYSRNEPARLNRGDEIEATGVLDRRTNRLTADRVRIVRDNSNNGGDNQTLRGTVTDERRGQDSFVMRANDGRTYSVDTRRTNQPNVRTGQTVEVRGRIQGNTLLANNVRVIDDGNTGGNTGGNNQTLTRGTVIDENRGQEGFTIRADNGRTYLVGTRNSNRLNVQRGQTVEVRGRVLGDSIFANNVRVISGGDSSDDRVMTGRVTSDYSGRDFEIRADNGRSVTVRARRGEPIRLSRGDRVEVRGEMENGVFQADSVRILRNDNNNGNNNRDRVNFTATVQRGGTGTFTVRADNGRDYTVQNGNVSVGYGDRVRIVGFADRGVIRAESVRVTGRNPGNDNNQGESIRLDAVVRQVGNGFLAVRDGGRDFIVQTGNARSFRVGDRVRVEGYRRNDRIVATSVTNR